MAVATTKSSRRHFLRLAGSVVCGYLQTSATAQSSRRWPTIQSVANLVADLHRRSVHHVSAVSVAVSVDGRLVHAGAVGLRDEAEAANPDTSFAIGSVTKPFTAAAVLKLIDEGSLALDSPVIEWLPEMFGGGPSPVTIRMLLNHTAGAPEYLPFRTVAWTRPIESADLMRWLLTNVPATWGSTPGLFRYSNGNYLMLGRLIEKVSRQEYGRYLRQQILKPAGLKHTGFGPRAEDCATGHHDGRPVVPIDSTWAFAAGGIYASAPDLVTWCQAFARGLIVSKALSEQARRRSAVGRSFDYGFGWKISRQEPLVYHDGLIDGFSSYLGIYQVEGKTVCTAVLANDDAASGLDQVSSRIAELASAE